MLKPSLQYGTLNTNFNQSLQRYQLFLPPPPPNNCASKCSSHLMHKLVHQRKRINKNQGDFDLQPATQKRKSPVHEKVKRLKKIVKIRILK